MHRADFYVLTNQDRQARLLFACKLSQKAIQNRLEIGIWAESDAMAVELDKLLWTWQPESYLPHALVPAPEKQPPILIGSTLEQIPRSFIINLSHTAVPATSHSQRVAEIVIQHERVLQQTRQRYREYQERGFQINMHNL